jgi:hypothetical protein
MKQIQDDATVELVQTRLARARQALVADNLSEAESYIKGALGVEGEHPQRATEIRLLLKKYIERVIAVDPPQLDKAGKALKLFDTFELQNNETHILQQKFELKRADSFLRQENLTEGFKIFTELMKNYPQPADQDTLKAEISGIVRVNMAQWANDRAWSLLSDIIEPVTRLWPQGELNEWLQTISKALAAVDQATAQAHQEHEQLTQRLKQAQQRAEQAEQRSQYLTYTGIAIIVLAVLAFILRLNGLF